ncbi:YncE family protein [Actinopolyspora saharensis]|uniref:YncE family protein n=1 Tax=Actinopolyspora saharensis TaxID=995062 RepID=UPI003F66CEE8
MRRLIAACLAASALLAGCSDSDGGSRPLQVTDELTAATPATSPPTTTEPAGRVVPAPPADHTVVLPEQHTLALAGADRASITLFDTRAIEQPPRTVDLPAPAASLRPVRGGQALLAALPAANAVAEIDLASGRVHRTAVSGGPVDALPVADKLFVARPQAKDVAILRDGEIQRRVDGFPGAHELLRRGSTVVVLDRLTTSLTPLDIDTGDKQPALRAGEGATRAVTDRFGRVLVVDTRGAEIMAFSTEPLIMKQRSPAGGSPYGLAYDPAQDLAWVTLTARNELVGYDTATGQAEQSHRVPTVRQPESVAVNPETGTRYIASAAGAGLQVVRK